MKSWKPGHRRRCDTLTGYDCIIVGGGPAGLSAALLLGRCRRRVLLCDTGEPRNRWATAVNGFFSRDGVPPQQLLELAREQLLAYDTVELRAACVEDADRIESGFEVRLAGGVRARSRTLLLATGVVDDVPAIDGFAEGYGHTVHHCPYCDGWEYRDRAVAVYGRGDAGFGLAIGFTAWTRTIVLCTDGPSGLDAERRTELEELDIVLREEPVERLVVDDRRVSAVVLAGGAAVPCDGVFFSTGQRQASPLPAKFGCHFTSKGAVATGTRESTEVPGLYVAGDASKNSQLVAIAVAEGTEAGFEIHQELLRADVHARRLAARTGTRDRSASAAEDRS